MKNRFNSTRLLSLCVALSLGALATTVAPPLAFAVSPAVEDLNEAEGIASNVRGLVSKAKYGEARPLAERVLALREKRLPKDSNEIAEALNDLGVILTNLTEFKAAEAALDRALAIREKVLGKEHEHVAIILNNLAFLRIKTGEYNLAEPLYKRALAIQEKEHGAVHRSVALAVHNLGLVYLRMGRFAEAEPLLLRSLDVRKHVYDPEHPATAVALNALGGLYRNLGDFRKAEENFEKAVTILHKAVGAEHPEIASALNNLAELHLRKGDTARAKKLFERALAIREKVSGPTHPDVARALDNLAVIYIRSGDLARAEPMVLRAIEIEEKTLGPNHPDLAFAFYHRSEILRTKGDLDQAGTFADRAIAIWKKALGPDHPYIAMGLAAKAEIAKQKGDLPQAGALFKRTLEIREAALGPEHPDLTLSLDALARIELMSLRPEEARKLLTRSIAISDRHAALVLATGSEQQKQAFMTTLRSQTDLAIALHALFERGRGDAARLALSTLLLRKGRVLDAVTDSVATLRARFLPKDQEKLDNLINVQRRLAGLVLQGPRSMSPSEYRTETRKLEVAKERAEYEVSQRSADYLATLKPISVEDVQASIPAEAALVELVRYSPTLAGVTRTPGTAEPPRYAAYILRKHGELAFADLGEADPIDALVDELRPALADRKRDPKPAARKLDEAVLKPLIAALGDTRWVILSPDAALNLIPFGALVGEDGRYRIETFSFTYLTSGRDLLRIAAPQPESRTGPLVLGNPTFDVKATIQKPPPPPGEEDLVAPEPDRAVRRSVDMTQIGFPPLSGTATEVASIGREVKGASILVGERATEQALKSTHGPSIVHLATHGFFLDDKATATPEASRGVLLEEASVVNALGSENPLLRSGLALAGANQRSSGTEDGVLTALEAAGLDLSGTKLVVLSACETGVGETRSGEGVYGLRRALVLAGSEAQVMSLWKVSDAATRDLMVAYYKKLADGGGRSEAMRQVELEMKARPDRSHPYYWASFIVSGNGAALDGTPVLPNFSPIAPPKVEPALRGCACEMAETSEDRRSGEGALLGAAMAAAMAAAALTRRASRRS